MRRATGKSLISSLKYSWCWNLLFSKEFNLILDLGCGSGNVTKLLISQIKYKRLIGIDVDPDMVKFISGLSEEIPNAEFIVEDIGHPWETLNVLLKQLEGKFDLIFSNRVFHWVQDKPTGAANIARLLKPGGQFYANITLIRDVNQHLPENERTEMELLVKVPPLEVQMENYIKIFSNCGGLTIRDSKFLEKSIVYEIDNLYRKLT